MSTGQYDLNALLARHRAIKQTERPLPCVHWCQLATLPSRTFSGAMGHCTCQEPCQWEGCPMDVEQYVPPPVPQFARQDEIREGAIDEIAEALRELEEAAPQVGPWRNPDKPLVFDGLEGAA